MPTSAHTQFDARQAQAEASERQSELNQLWFGSDAMSTIEMIVPLINDICESEFSITPLFGRSPSAEATTVEQWKSAAHLPLDDTNHIIIAIGGYLHSGPSDRTVEGRMDQYPSIRDRFTEPSLIPWYLATPLGEARVYGGSVAPGLITLPFWVRTVDYTPEEQELFRASFTDAIRQALDHTTLDKWYSESTDALEGRYTDIVGSRTTAALDLLRADIDTLLREQDDYEQRVRTNEVLLREKQAQFHAMNDAMVPDEEIAREVEREIKLTLEHPDILTAAPGVESNSVEIFTSQLPLVNIANEESTIGGTYRIRITFGITPTIEIRNLTHRFASFDHPHVSNGSFCLGDQRNLVSSLLTKTELSAAIGLIIDLLKQVNPDDVYTSDWESWFSEELE